MDSRPAALFVFAHQDDEFAAASRIRFEVALGRSVLCVYLTDGDAGHASPRVRNRESTAVLTFLGVSPDSIFFPGSELPIADGNLVHSLDAALEQLNAVTGDRDLRAIYCLAWEGGHQDHDASHLVTAAFARSRNLLGRCYEIPLYRGSKIHPRVFRVFSPVPGGNAWERRKLPSGEGFRVTMLAWRYPSQRRSFLGLFPEAFFKLAILRRELVRPVDLSRATARPHRGPLLYERRFHFSYERFSAAAAAFVDRHFRQPGGG